MAESDYGARPREGAPSDCEVSTLRFVLVCAIAAVTATALFVAVLSLPEKADMWWLATPLLWIVAVCGVAIILSAGHRCRVRGGELIVFDKKEVYRAVPVDSVCEVVARSWKLHLGITFGEAGIILPGLLRKERAALCRAIHAGRRGRR